MDRFFTPKRLSSLPLFVLLLAPAAVKSASSEPQSAVVIVPMADVWSRPLAPGEIPKDDLRETQVLPGEKVIIHESSGSWVYIEAVEQPTFRQHNKWEGYPGWVQKSALIKASEQVPLNAVVITKWLESATIRGRPVTRLPLGSRARVIEKRGGGAMSQIELMDGRADWVLSRGLRTKPPPIFPGDLRKSILETTALLIGDPYAWGGLTPAILPPSPAPSPPEGGEGIKYGVDCSGLVHLAYRVNGMTIPRDSHEQWMKAKPIKRAELKPGDLIFSAKASDPKKIVHVAIYAGFTPHPHPLPSERGEGIQGAGDGQIIEAPQTGMVVRKISFKEKYGKPLEEVESGDRVGERIIYFGSYLHDGSPVPEQGTVPQEQAPRDASGRGG